MSKFKVGDKVMYVGESVFPFSGNIETVVRIENYESNKIFVKSGGFFYEENLELAEASKTEIQVNYILLPDSVTLSFDAQLVSIAKSDHRYKAIIEAIREDNLELIPELVDVAASFSNIEGVELVDGRIKLDGKDIPEVLSDRVLAFKDQDLPFEPLIKFAEKLLENPSFNSRKMLYKFLEKNGHPITKNGNFIAYKGVNDDFTDRHTGKFDNSVGQTVEMDRK